MEVARTCNQLGDDGFGFGFGDASEIPVQEEGVDPEDAYFAGEEIVVANGPKEVEQGSEVVQNHLVVEEGVATRPQFLLVLLRASSVRREMAQFESISNIPFSGRVAVAGTTRRGNISKRTSPGSYGAIIAIQSWKPPNLGCMGDEFIFVCGERWRDLDLVG